MGSSGKRPISPILPTMAKSRQPRMTAIGLEGKLNASCRPYQRCSMLPARVWWVEGCAGPVG